MIAGLSFFAIIGMDTGGALDMLLYPDIYLDSIDKLDIKKLKEMGFEALIFDIDNTIIGWNIMVPDERSRRIINEAVSVGMKVCFISNGTKKRVVEFASALGVPYVCNAGKPLKIPYRKALKLLKVNPRKVVAIGDQVFTDIIGANRLGFFTILVHPISTKENEWTRFVRRFERFVLNKYSRNIKKNDL